MARFEAQKEMLARHHVTPALGRTTQEDRLPGHPGLHPETLSKKKVKEEKVVLVL